MPVDMVEDDPERLQELTPACRLCCDHLLLGSQGRADVVEPAAQEIVLVAVVGVEGRASDIGPLEDVLDRGWRTRFARPVALYRAPHLGELLDRIAGRWACTLGSSGEPCVGPGEVVATRLAIGQPAEPC